MAQYQRTTLSTIQKTETLSLQLELPMAELIAGVRDDIEALCGAIGLKIILAVMPREIEKKIGPLGPPANLSSWQTKGLCRLCRTQAGH